MEKNGIKAGNRKEKIAYSIVAIALFLILLWTFFPGDREYQRIPYDVVFLGDSVYGLCRDETSIAAKLQLAAPEGTPQRDITDIFRNGWSAGEKGAYLEFTFRGTGAAVQYRRVKDGPAPIATAVVDENPETACVLDGTFDETWGDKMQLTTVAEHLPYGEHRVHVEITETHAEDKAEFYLVSVIVSGVREEGNTK